MKQLYTRRGFTQGTVNIRVDQVLPDNKMSRSNTNSTIQGKDTNFIAPSSGMERAEFMSTRVRGRFSQGFTLIELLVAVLIIGILAAVALPQYQRAVEKSKAAQAFIIIRTMAAAQESYYMEHGTYAHSFNALDIDVPLTGTRKWIDGSSWAARSNNDWSLQLYYEGNGIGISMGRISGPYAGAGFVYLLENLYFNYPLRTLLCHESHYTRETSVPFTKNNGDYCKKIFNTPGDTLSPLP